MRPGKLAGRTLSVIGAGALLWWIYGALVPEPADRLPANRVSDDSDDFDPLRAFALNTGAPIVEGNRLELLENGDEIFPAMLDAIADARESIDLLTYVYWEGDIAQAFAQALSDAARRGIRVRVILDAWGAKRMHDELVDAMEAAGCEVAWYHPVNWYTLRRINYRTHRKVLVVDDSVGFTGGVGIAAEWTGDAQDPDHWRDDHFRVHGPVVRHLGGAFAENWRQATGELIARYDVPGAREDVPDVGTATGDATDAGVLPGTSRVVPVITSPRGDVSEIGLLYWTVLQRARRSVDIMTPYFVPDPSVIDAIVAAAERGVRIRLLVPGPHNDSWMVRIAALERFPELLDAGVEVHIYQPTMMHVKMVTADGRWSIVGSPNFDNRSFELNDEVALLVDDTDFARTLEASFERDLERTEQLTPETMERVPFWRRGLSHVALLLREQL